VAPSAISKASRKIVPKTQVSLRQLLLLLLLTAGAILVHGYHPYVEDAAIYVPGIKKILNPALYPFNADFFASHARLTLFPNLIAGFVRITRVPLDWALFLWHFFSIFLLLLACWHLGRICFRDPRARWGGVALVAALLTIPVAGTALYLMDQYLNPRSLSTPAVLFLVINTVERKFVRAVLWAGFTAAIHPLMVVFGFSYVVLLVWMGRSQFRARSAAALFLLPVGLFPPVTSAYREVIENHSYFLLLRWEWYEWLGIFAPLALLWWFHRLARKQDRAVLELLCRTGVVFGVVFFVAALVITIPPAFAALVKLQPMRALHLVYVLLSVCGGGLLAERVLKNRVTYWALLLVPLCAGMWLAQRELFPATPHVEWPSAAPRNDWVQAFLWIRSNTPQDAYFALDPRHMERPGEDQHGFRALAERSMLADTVKDSGVVTMFPALADTWREQVDAQHGWKAFDAADFRRLKERFGVNWVVSERPSAAGLTCPYQSVRLAVCQIP
jgi:hypothetical protein